MRICGPCVDLWGDDFAVTEAAEIARRHDLYVAMSSSFGRDRDGGGTDARDSRWLGRWLREHATLKIRSPAIRRLRILSR